MPDQWVVEVHRADPLTLIRVVRHTWKRLRHVRQSLPPEWVPHVSILRRGMCSLVLVADSQAQIDRRQQHEHVRLDHRHTKVQSQEDERYADRDQREERQRY